MTKGWFVGNFAPTAFCTGEAEVAVKPHCAGDYEGHHMHKVARELTLIPDGEVKISGMRYKYGDIVLIEPGEVTDFKAITDVTTVVVKVPSVKATSTNAEYRCPDGRSRSALR